MSTIRQMLFRAKIAHKSIPSDMTKIVKILSEDILDLIRERQLHRGLNSEGKIIGRYTAATEQISGGRKKEGQPYDFLDTGDLFRGFKYNFKGGELEIFSTDSKFDQLKWEHERGNGKLFVLSEENQHLLNFEMIKPMLVRFLKSHLKI